LLLLFLFTAPASAFTTTQTLTEPTAVAGDQFGTSVAIAGSTMVVGAPYAGPTESGEVDIYTQASDGKWTFLQTLDGPNGMAEQFGQSVAISGDTIVVGAPAASSAHDEGSVWVYVKSSSSASWPTSATQTLAAPTTPIAFGEQFGYSVAISGELLAIGAPGADQALVYTDDYGYANPAVISDPKSGEDEFGHAVAISGDTVFVGAPTTTQTTHSEAGAAYYETDVPASGQAWVDTTLKTLPETRLPAFGTDAEFGYALAVQGGTLVVGVPGAGGSKGGEQGEAVAFNVAKVATTGPSLLAPFQPAEDSGASPQFGSSVAVYGSSIALGTGTSAGTAVVFVTNTRLVHGALPGGLYGGGVALSATTAVAGSPGVSASVGAVGSFFNAPPPTAAQILASLKGLLSPSGKTIKEIYKARFYNFNYTAIAKGKLLILWYDGRTIEAAGTIQEALPGHTRSIRVSLTAQGRKLFKSAHKLKLRSLVGFNDLGKILSAGKSFTLR
jgi:hypothetical protein